MNNNEKKSGDLRSYLLLEEIASNDTITQRDLSTKLGIALGLTNSYLKNLVNKGYITVSEIPRNRYKYYLTRKGFIEKSRLAYHHLQNFTGLYRVARRDFSALFRRLSESDIKKVSFCGVDEVTEIAYLSLKEVDISLVAVMDDGRAGQFFLDQKVLSLGEGVAVDCDLIVLTSFNEGQRLIEMLVESGVSEEKICDIGSGGWLQKLSEPL